LRQEAHRLVVVDERRAVALGKFAPLLVEDDRDVRERWRLPAEGLVYQKLFGGVRQMLFASDNVRDAHAMVIGDNGEIIQRAAVAFDDDEVRHGTWRKRDVTSSE